MDFMRSFDNQHPEKLNRKRVYRDASYSWSGSEKESRSFSDQDVNHSNLDSIDTFSKTSRNYRDLLRKALKGKPIEAGYLSKEVAFEDKLATFNRERELLAKDAADIKKLKHEYQAGVVEFYQVYPEYPRHGDFRTFNKDAEASAKEKEKKYRLMNEGLAFFALHKIKRMSSSITNPREFKATLDLILNQGNSEDDIKSINKAMDNLGRLNDLFKRKEISADRVVLKEMLLSIKTCWQETKGIIAKQISKANQRLTEFEDQVKDHGEIVESYEGPTINDIPAQARQRAEQARQRAEQSEEHAKCANAFAERVTKLAGQSEEHTKLGEEITQQIKKLAELANKLAKPDEEYAKELGKQVAQFEKQVETLSTQGQERTTQNKEHAHHAKELATQIEEYARNAKNYAVNMRTRTKDEKGYNDKGHTKQAAQVANQAMELTKQIAKYADQAVELVKEPKILNIEKAIGAAKYAREIAGLELAIVEYAKEAAKNAEFRATELEKNSNESTIENSSIESEKEMFKHEEKLALEIIEKQKEMIENLRELKIENSYEYSDLNKEDSHAYSEINGSRDTEPLEKARYNNEVSSLIKDANLLLEVFNKHSSMYQETSKQYKLLESNRDNLNDIEVQAEFARNLAAQYSERAKQTKDRAKRYEEQLKLLQTSRLDAKYLDIASSTISFSKRIAHLERKMQMQFESIARNAENIVEATKIENRAKNIADTKALDAIEMEDNKSLGIKEKATEIKRCAKNNISNISKQIEKDLSNIKTLYKKEVNALKEVETVEKELVKSAQEDREALEKVRQHFEDTLEIAAQKGDPIVIKDQLRGSLEELKDSLNNHLSRALESNSLYIQNRTKIDSKQASDNLDVLAKNSKVRDVKNIVDLSVGHMIIDPEFSGMTMVNGVCMFTREIRSIKCNKETGITTIVWREDIPEFTVFDQKEYTKRISDFEINTKDRTLSFKSAGNTYRRPGDERTKVIIEDNGIKREYDSKSLKKVVVTKHEKSEGDLELAWRAEVKTMPDDTIRHDDNITCYSREGLANMHRFNLAANIYAPPDNQITGDIPAFDFTETRMDNEHGLILVGEGEYSMLCLKYVGTLSSFINKLKDIEDNIKTKTINYEKKCVELLKQSIETHDQSIIKKSFTFVEESNGLAMSDTSAIEYQLKRPPKRIEELKWLNKNSKSTLERISLAHMRDAEEMLKARNAFDNAVNQRIINIHKKYPLTREEIILAKHSSNDHKLEMHPSSKAKKKLLKEIYMAYHLDKTFDFPLLVDPNKGREVKCSNPDTLMLVEEYSMYMDKKFSKEEGLSKEEERYVKEIEMFADEADDKYLRNEIYQIKAENYLSSDLNQVFNALKELSGGDRPPISESAFSPAKPSTPTRGQKLIKFSSNERSNLDSSKHISGNENSPATHANSLDNLRQNDEYQLVDYLDKAIARVTTEGIDGLIWGPLGIAKRMRQSRLNTLRLAKETLNLETPSDAALRAIDHEPIDKLPPSTQIVQEDKQEYSKKIDNLEHEVNQLIQDGLKNKNPSDYAKKSVDLAWKMAALSYQTHVDSMKDSMCKKDFEARAVEIQTEMAKHSLTEFKAMLHLRHFDDQKKLMYSMMWHDIVVTLASSGYLKLNQYQARIGNLFARLIADLFKISSISK